ncbi:MAG: HAD family phosphatase [Succiniclasticum sp.]|nr:HAD family phosphatase [Acidaminococcaceae bacterium]MBQ6913666.1 HAD family phosphatase [Acidaminococcaceae bacterium]MEE3455233.1 HAD family phosphatase [Succiniclasticum sp.]
MIRNMVFDIGNVLMDFRWKEYMRSLFGEDETLIQTINQGIWHNGCWAAMDKGEMDGAATLRSAVAFAPQYEKEIKLTLDSVAHAFHKFEYSIPWIQELKRMGLNVYYLSNYSAFSVAANPDVLDFIPYMDGGVFSFEVKAVKPEPEIYRCLCEKFGLKPEECLFTDDVPANVKGAQACGFQGIVFEGYEKTYPLIMKALR